MTPEPQDVKPLPCPFCKGIGKLTPVSGGWCVECDDCHARGPKVILAEGALGEWNRRTPSPSTGGASSLRAQIEALPRLSPAADFGDGGAYVLGVEHSADGRYLDRDAVLALCGDAPGGGTSDRYVIWSGEHSSWWAPNSSGYTPSILGAGLYSREDAERVTAMCGPEKQITIRALADALGSPRDDTAGQLLLALMQSEGSSGAPST